MRGDLCCIFNYAPHYRFPIFESIGKELGASFYFGDVLEDGAQLKKLDYAALPGFKKELRTHFFGPFEWTSGWIKAAFDRRWGRFLISKNYYALNQWIFLIVCKLLGKPVYAWMHGMRSSTPAGNGSRTTLRLARWYDSLLQGSFLYGERSRQNMIAMGYAPEKLHVIYNSLDYRLSLSMRDAVPQNPYPERFGNDDPVLLFIGRLLPAKRLDLLVEAFRILKSRDFPVNVALLGGGPEEKKIQEAVGTEDAGRFWFSGPMYDERQIHCYLYHASLCVSPGNVGLTAIHALSHGLPVVTNDDFDSQMPEFEAVVPGVTGDFFKKGDAADLAETVLRWLSGCALDRDNVRKECYKVIDAKYNPEYQTRLLKSVIYAEGAGFSDEA